MISSSEKNSEEVFSISNLIIKLPYQILEADTAKEYKDILISLTPFFKEDGLNSWLDSVIKDYYTNK